jgi:hypothetical protein
MAAVQQDGWALQFVPEAVRDEKLYMAAVQQNGSDLKDVPSLICSGTQRQVTEKQVMAASAANSSQWQSLTADEFISCDRLFDGSIVDGSMAAINPALIVCLAGVSAPPSLLMTIRL